TAKVASAAATVHRLNPHVAVETHATRLVAANALDLIGHYDVVADGSDNFSTRYLVSDACYFAGKPLITAAMGTFDGTITSIRAHERAADGTPNPTYRCLFPEPPPAGTVPTCAEAGVLGAMAGVLGSLMALEAIREIVGFGEGLVGRLLMLDARSMRFETLRYGWDPANPISGEHPTIRDLSVHKGASRAGSLRPVRDRLSADDHGPFILAARGDALAVLFRTFPGRAESVLGQLPGALVFGAALVERLARHLAVRREHHLEL